MNELHTIIEEVLQKNKRNTFTFLTGAGISAASGIPTYRGTDGIWVKGTRFHKPEKFGTLEYFNENQEEVWQYSLFRKKMIEEANPNASHTLLFEMENLLKDRFHLITQNIDNLHRRAGNKNIYEIHGNYREVKCSNCEDVLPMPSEINNKEEKEDLTQNEINILQCKECQDWLRPNILWFDEFYNEKTHKRFSALKIAKNSGVLFILGTSGATNLPIEIAKTTLKYGGYVIDINIEDNKFTELLEGKKRGLKIRAECSEILPQIKKLIENSSELSI